MGPLRRVPQPGVGAVSANPTVKPDDVAPVKPAESAVRVLPLPTNRGRIALNVATPLTAATVRVLLAANEVLALLMVTFAVLVVALPNASWITTVTAGVIALPEVTVLGCTPKAS